MKLLSPKKLMLYSVIVICIYALYAYLSDAATGNVIAEVAWGLVLLAGVLFTTGVTLFIFQGHAAQPMVNGHKKHVPKDQKMLGAGILTIAIGAIIGGFTGAAQIFGTFAWPGFFLVVISMSMAKKAKKAQPIRPAAPSPQASTSETKETVWTMQAPVQGKTSSPQQQNQKAASTPVVMPSTSDAPASIDAPQEPINEGAIWLHRLRWVIIAIPFLFAIYVVVSIAICASDESCQLFAP